MKKKLSKILVGLLVVVCIVEGFFLYRAYVVPSSTLQTARKINRIEQIIDKDIKEGHCEKVVTRFPPEPNGYLHILDMQSPYYLTMDLQRNTMVSLI